MSSEDGIPEVLSADVAALVDTGGFKFSVYLVRRDGETEHGKLALLGGRKDPADKGRILATAKRETKEEGNIDVEEDTLEPLIVLDGHGRGDPRGVHRTSIVFVTELLPHQHRDARAGDGASELLLIPLAEVPLDEMAFDHARAILALRKKFG